MATDAVVQAQGYYCQNGIIYREDLDKGLQQEANKACQMGAALIRADEDANRYATGNWTGQGATWEVKTLRDPWFWMSMHLIHNTQFSHIPAGGGCGSCSGGGNRDGCAIVLLVIAIAAAVCAFFVAIGFAVHEGIEARKIQERKQEVKQLEAQTKNQTVQAVYQNILPILEYQHNHEITKLSFNVVLAVGFGLLSAAAALALYGVIQQAPIPSLATNLAIGGGSVAGVGLLGHIIRALCDDEESRVPLYKTLFDKMVELRSQLLTHPVDILKAVNQNNVYLKLGNRVFYTVKNQIYGLFSTNMSGLATYSEVQIKNVS